MENMPASPACDRMQEFKLYVNNLPEELNQNGIKEIFNEYGNIIGFFARPGSGWAYITYERYNEAENAIRDLHEKGPLHLQVTFAKQKATDSRPKSFLPENNVRLSHSSPKERVQSRETNFQTQDRQSLGHASAVKCLQANIPNPSYPAHSYTPEDDLLYPVPVDSQTYNPYANEEPFASTNHLWTKGQLTVTKDGKRHVSLGRGYTKYEIPEPHPKVQEHLTKVHEKRMRGMYEYKEDVLKHSTGRCLKCKKLTKFTCERCRGFYCGSECQISDWARHKIECQPIPALIKAVNSTSISESSSEEQVPERQVRGVERTLRKPKRLIEEEEKAQSGTAYTKTNENDKSSLGQVRSQSLKNPGDDDFNFVPHKGYRNVNQSNSSYRKKLESQNSSHTLKEKTMFPTELSNNLERCKSSLPQPNMLTPSHKTADKNEGPNFDNAKDTPPKKSFYDDFYDPHARTKNNAMDKLSNPMITKTGTPEEDFTFQKDTFLSKTVFTNVQIVLKCSDTTNNAYWVHRVKDVSRLNQLMNNLQIQMNKAEKVSPIVGKLYAVKYETVWQRAQLVSKSPTVVHYIDYGNDENIIDNDFRSLGSLAECDRLARKICLPQNVSAKYRNLKPDDTLSVKMVSVNSDNVIMVEVKEDEETQEKVQSEEPQIDQKSSNQTPLEPDQNKKSNVDSQTETKGDSSSGIQRLPSVLSYVTTGMEGCLEVHAPLENNSYGITFLPKEQALIFEKILFGLPAVCADTTVSTDFKPAINSLVCAQREDGDWIRGYVSNLGPPPCLIAVDEARTMPVTKLIPYPEQFMDLPTMGAICKLLNTEQKLTPQARCSFTVVEHKKDANNQDLVEVKINVDGHELQAHITPIKVAPEQRGISLAKLKSGSEVYITTYRSATTMYVQSLDSKTAEHYHRVMQGVQKCAQTAAKVEKPVVGQVVIAPFSDNNKYRAVVTEIVDEKVAVSYVDFGNTEYTSISNLQVLSDELKLLPSCATKVILKDVPQDVAMTKEASVYLSHLAGREVPLICTFDGVPSKDGVYLETAKGESVNKKLVKLLAQSYDRGEEEDKTVYMSDHMIIGTLGDVGNIITAIVLYEKKPGSHYVLCLKNPELMTHIAGVMQPLVNKYCESTSYYIPRKEELCLALYEGDWYRAICVMPKAECALVHFVDYGNAEMVEYKDIRLMPKDFVTPEALGNCCKIVAPDGKSYSEDHEKIIATFMQPNMSVKIKVVKVTERGIYEIEVPDIHAKLLFQSTRH